MVGIQAPEQAALRKEDLVRSPSAFQVQDRSIEDRHDMAGLLAASFLKYCEQAKQFCEQDSVDGFITLNQLYKKLYVQARQYLREDIPFVMEGQPIEPLLLGFAGYRLNRASRIYYYRSISHQPDRRLAKIKAFVAACQQDLDNVMQSL
ncbi:MAG: hypothetical protein KTR14_02940 [Vampirovibrio sp.]|nr:hypothetical protein [Vampirovibrio sp.]